LLFWVAAMMAPLACGPSQSTDQTTEGETAEETAPAEDPTQRPSPLRQAQGTIGDAQVTVSYGSPSVRGRNIWGELVPYSQLWRTGANEATTVTVDKDVMVEGQRLPAGRYALFTIPGPNKWTVIFNTDADQWGGYNYDQGKDILRVDVTPVMREEHVEAMEIAFIDDGLELRWEKLVVPIKISQG
jgi:hypothetical protein